MPDRTDWPHAFRAALASPPLERRAWSSTLAPQLIGLFLWIAFFDQIPQEGLTPYGLVWPVLGAALASLLCYLLLYRSAAMWGMATGRPLGVIATSTFGIRGATWVPGLLQALAAVVWFAVANFYATYLSLRGLVLVQLLDPKYLHPMNPGRGGTPGVLFLVTLLFWCYSSAFVGRYLVRVIAALMNVFVILPALILGVTTILAFSGLRGYHAAGALRSNPLLDLQAGTSATLVVVQMIFGFFATSGLSSADWGRVARNSKDVRSGGWVGVAMASWVVSTLAILTVAGAGSKWAAWDTMRYSAALEALVGGRLAGAMLLVFGLAALAPACYSSYVFSSQLHEIWPRVKRTHWTILGAGLAWLIVSSGRIVRMSDVFTVVGGLVAPAAGALSADYVRSRGVWPGPRIGYNLPGLLAWALGSALGLLPLIGRMLGLSRLTLVQPAALLGFLLAFTVYLIAAGFGAEPGIETPFESQPLAQPSGDPV